jgi:hypothetical protein
MGMKFELAGFASLLKAKDSGLEEIAAEYVTRYGQGAMARYLQDVRRAHTVDSFVSAGTVATYIAGMM